MRRIILSIGIPATLISFLTVSALLARRPRHERMYYERAAEVERPETFERARVVMPGAIVEMSHSGCVTVAMPHERSPRAELLLRRSLERCLESYARAAVAAGRNLSDEQRALVDSLNERVHQLSESLDAQYDGPGANRRRYYRR